MKSLFFITVLAFFALLHAYMLIKGNRRFGVNVYSAVLFTLIVSHIIDVILCFMGMTDSHLYKIKEF